MRYLYLLPIIAIVLCGCASSPESNTASIRNWIIVRCHSDTPITERLSSETLNKMERLVNRDPVFKINLQHHLYEYDSYTSFYVVEKPYTATFGIGLPERRNGNLLSLGPYVEVNYVQNTALMRYMIAVKGKNQFDQDDPNSTYIATVNLNYTCHQ